MIIYFFILFIVVLTLVKIIGVLYTKDKGFEGEAIVSRDLSNVICDEYKVINNLMIMTSNGTTQIDHVVVSVYGIFVIETKNYSGWIYGNEHSEYWTQTIYGYRTRFRNPIKQNWAHIYGLKEVLKAYDQIQYIPIVVFAGSAELKKIVSSVPVIYQSDLLQTINNYKRVPVISVNEVNMITSTLLNICIKDKEVEKNHIQKINRNIDDRYQKEKMLLCPKCNSQLVVRNGPYGKFYGCSNYPNCKYTKRCYDYE